MFIILCRTQRGALVAITKLIEGEDVVAEYKYEVSAIDAAENNPACQAGIYEILEVEI